MSTLNTQRALVIGATGGFGAAIVSALHAAGAAVWAAGRDEGRLAALKADNPDIHLVAADATEEADIARAIDRAQPTTIILAVGAVPHMAPVHTQTWEQFSQVWETDTRAAFLVGQQALRRPLPPGSQVVFFSSGAAIGGSPLSGGYAGAKRMQWLLANYLQKESDAAGMDVRFVTLLPGQIVGTTALGRSAAEGYASHMGITSEKFLERFGAPLTTARVGELVCDLLAGDAGQDGAAFMVRPEGLSPAPA